MQLLWVGLAELDPVTPALACLGHSRLTFFLLFVFRRACCVHVREWGEGHVAVEVAWMGLLAHHEKYCSMDTCMLDDVTLFIAGEMHSAVCDLTCM